MCSLLSSSSGALERLKRAWRHFQLVNTGSGWYSLAFYGAFWEFLVSVLTLEMADSPGCTLITELGSWLRHTLCFARLMLRMSTALIALIHHRDVYLMCVCFHLKDVIFRACDHVQYVTMTLQLMLEWRSEDVYTAFMN